MCVCERERECIKVETTVSADEICCLTLSNLGDMHACSKKDGTKTIHIATHTPQ